MRGDAPREGEFPSLSKKWFPILFLPRVVLQQNYFISPTADKRPFLLKCVYSLELVVQVSDALEEKKFFELFIFNYFCFHLQLLVVLLWAFFSLEIQISTLNIWNHFLHVLYETASSPEAKQIILLTSTPFFQLKCEKEAVPQMLLFEWQRFYHCFLRLY